MLKINILFLLLFGSIIFFGNKAHSGMMPAENLMPDKLHVPAELLNVRIPSKLPSINSNVDMPKLPSFERVNKFPALRTLNGIPPGHPESYELLKGQVFIWPVIGKITSSYGFRLNGTSGGIHEGIDISMPRGTPIKASAGGVVKRADSALRGYGNIVIIDHGNGVETRYAHCSAFAVTKGDVVSAGQIIAYVGDSGRATSNHLHFEIVINGLAYNPIRFLGEYQTVLTSMLAEIIGSH